MKILGGNQVVFYATIPGNLEVQLTDCMEQLEEYMDEQQIYPGSMIRHNLFVNVTDEKQFHLVKPKLEMIAKRRFPLPLIINIIAQAPAEGDIALESTHILSTQWNCLYKEVKYGTCQHLKKGKLEVVIGSVQVNISPEIRKNAEKAFEKIESLLGKCGLEMCDIVKQWNYIERLLEEDITTQRYQTFNDVRTKYYDTDFEGIGYPASTEIGTTSGGILIEFMAVKNRKELSVSINNPIQKATYEYSEKVLMGEGAYDPLKPTTPKVERGRYLKIEKKEMVFISATAAIVGERVVAVGDVIEQTHVILENFNKLISVENLISAGVQAAQLPKFSLVKAYVRNEADMIKVLQLLDSKFKDIPLLLVQADLPRKDILIEMEGEVVF